VFTVADDEYHPLWSWRHQGRRRSRHRPPSSTSATRNGPYADLFDLCTAHRSAAQANRRVLEALIKAGALDHFELRGFSSCTLSELKPGRKRVAGLIMGVRIIKTRRGRIAIVTLDDQTARVEVTVYRDLFEQHMDKLVTDHVVVVEGNCDVDEFSGDYSIQCEDLMTLDEARNRLARALVLTVTEQELGNGFVGRLQEVIGSHGNGRCLVAIEYARDCARARIRLGDGWRVQVNDKLLDGLRGYLGEQRVHVEY
jgi:DNA polymerase III subunit alpha